MTDKELMEESLRGYCLECNPKCDNLTTRLSGYKDGFFAGLEAGRPQWHYPSEGDLPKESGEYLVIAESDHTLYTSLENYDPDDNEWSTCWKIVAWQHIDIPEEIYDKEV